MRQGGGVGGLGGVGEVGEVGDERALVEEVRVALAAAPGALTPHRVADALRAAGRPVGDATVLAVYEILRRDMAGTGPLEPLLHLPGVTDVLVNGPGPVRIDRGDGVEVTDVVIATEDDCRRLAQRLVASGGRRLDDAAPYADVRLPGGARCHAVLAPLSQPGTAISLRVPRRGGFSLADLEQAGALTAESVELLRQLVAARRAFLVSGGTGTGKTTLLGAMLSEVDPAERLVVVEDAAELRPDHPQVVGLETRPPNVEGVGAVHLRDLVRQALRMRPDRVVVGEVRDGSVVDLLAAMNTGHEGGCGTLHANSASDVPARVEALALAAGLGREAAHSQLASALDVVLHLVRDRASGRRRLEQVAVLDRGADGLVSTTEAVRFGADGPPVRGPGSRRLLALLDRAPA